MKIIKLEKANGGGNHRPFLNSGGYRIQPSPSDLVSTLVEETKSSLFLREG